MARLCGWVFVIGERKKENCGTTSRIETSGEIGAPPNVCIFGFVVLGTGCEVLLVSMISDFIHCVVV